MSISRKRLKALQILSNQERDYSDIPQTNATFWKNAQVVFPDRKEVITIRIDHAVVEWFKELGPRYQSRINAVLRSYVRAHQQKHS